MLSREGSSSASFEVPAAGFTVIEDVAPGDVGVEVLALEGEVVIASKSATARVTEGARSVVSIDLGAAAVAADGGVPSPLTSSAMTVRFELDGGDVIAGPKLEPAPRSIGAEYATFLGMASSRFGRAPAAVTLTAIELDILEHLSSGGANQLDDLWNGRLAFVITAGGAGARVEAAEIATPTGDARRGMRVIATRESLESVRAALVDGSATVTLSGPTDRRSSDGFQASIDLTLTWTASAD